MGVRTWDDCPARSVRKTFVCVCVFSVHCFLSPPIVEESSTVPVPPLSGPIFPDPPILAFFDFLAFFVFRFSLLFCAFFLSFPRILGVPRREKPLLFWGKTLAFFFPKSKDWRVRVARYCDTIAAIPRIARCFLREG